VITFARKITVLTTKSVTDRVQRDKLNGNIEKDESIGQT
jgi:hypothetical protein